MKNYASRSPHHYSISNLLYSILLYWLEFHQTKTFNQPLMPTLSTSTFPAFICRTIKTRVSEAFWDHVVHHIHKHLFYSPRISKQGVNPKIPELLAIILKCYEFYTRGMVLWQIMRHWLSTVVGAIERNISTPPLSTT